MFEEEIIFLSELTSHITHHIDNYTGRVGDKHGAPWREKDSCGHCQVFIHFLTEELFKAD